jgi:tetratricopeptide (TPR) repeat protein/DNA-binding CsgD family transcriptional regulator
MYFPKIDLINGVYFTQREIEVISCILNVRGVKKIAAVLSISPRTVEGHIQNIMLKLSCNSQESVKDFVEKSEQIIQINQYYLDLLITSFFKQQLKGVVPLFKKKKVTCIVHYQKNDVLDYIIKCLGFANVNVILNQNNELNDKEIPVILFDANEADLKEYEGYKSLILVCREQSLNADNLGSFTSINFIDCHKAEDIPTGIFNILKILAPDIDLSKPITEFNKLYNNILNLGNTSVTGTQISIEDVNPQKINIDVGFSSKKRWILLFITICVITALVAISFLFKGSPYPLNPAKEIIQPHVASNFSLLHRTVLLERPEVLAKIGKAFTGNDPIETVVLIGNAGAGKTTIARQYVTGQPASVLWEINAETKESLVSSIEQLLYALCDSGRARENLNKIIEIKDSEQREKQLIMLLEQKLKQHPNWFLIYDNVETFKSIQSYFPCNAKAWGNGRVIITTKDINIKNNNHIKNSNIIEIEELSKSEKYDLFSKIVERGEVDKELFADKIALENFLEEIPSFPLDVSVAAYYLKETGMPYDKYLEKIASPNIEFTALEENILESTNYYSKTRYSIITLSIKRIIAANPDFKDLLFFVSLLNSQKIPKELLLIYKGEIIVNSFIAELKKHSFISTNLPVEIDNHDYFLTFSMHRSTQRIILAYLTGLINLESQKNLLKSIINPLENYISKLAEAEETLKLKALQSNCEAILARGRNIMDGETRTSLDTSLGVVSYYIGDDLRAKEILESNLHNLQIYNHNGMTKSAWALLHLGSAYRKLGNYDKAIEFLTQSISLYKTATENNPDIGKALMTLGNVYRSKGSFLQAKIALQEGINVYKTQSVNHAGIAKGLLYLGVIYREEGDYNKAKSLLEESLETYKTHHYPYYSSLHARTLTHLGILYLRLGDYKKAQKFLQKGIDIYKKIRPENHLDIYMSILNLGEVYGEQGNYDSAKEFVNKAIANYEMHYGKEHLVVGKSLNHLGRIYILEQNLPKAKEVVIKALGILEKANHPEKYRSLELLGDMYAERSQKELQISGRTSKYKFLKAKSIKYFEQSLEVVQKYYPENSVNFIRLQSKVSYSKQEEI